MSVGQKYSIVVLAEISNKCCEDSLLFRQCGWPVVVRPTRELYGCGIAVVGGVPLRLPMHHGTSPTVSRASLLAKVWHSRHLKVLKCTKDLSLLGAETSKALQIISTLDNYVHHLARVKPLMASYSLGDRDDPLNYTSRFSDAVSD